MTPVVLLVTLAAGAAGALLRYGTTLIVARSRARIPWAVLIVNVVGSALGGVLLGLAVAGAVDPSLRFVLFAGLAGGLTTFSTLSVETLQLIEQRRMRTALASLGANFVLGIGAAAVGFAVTSALL